MSDKFEKEQTLYPKLVVKDTEITKADKHKKDQLREMRQATTIAIGQPTNHCSFLHVGLFHDAFYIIAGEFSRIWNHVFVYTSGNHSYH